MYKIFFKPSALVIVVIVVSWFALNTYTGNWSKDNIQNDIQFYYGYLPDAFVCHDLTHTTPKHNNPNCKNRHHPSPTPNGGHVYKMTMGLSFMYLPFFLVAHVISPALHVPQDGYSTPYQVCLLLSCLFYTLIGFYFLRKILLIYFSETIVAWVLFSLYFGTNLLFYTVSEPLYSHAYNFSLVAAMIYFTISWHKKPAFKKSLTLGIILGLLILIRPTNVILCLFPLLYGVYNRTTVKEKLKLIQSNLYQISAVGLLAFCILVPQLIYWKVNSGEWFFYSYQNEKFFFGNPHIWEGLFGFRKGWLIYTPIMSIAIFGMIVGAREFKQFFLPITILAAIFIYVTFSWWCWWYGGSFGQRSFIDTYALFAFPLAASYKFLFRKIILRGLSILVIVFFLFLNVFQSWQYSQGILHYEAMTKDAYFLIFGKTGYPETWGSKIRFPDYRRVGKGLPEEFIQEELYTGKYSFRAFNIKFIKANIDKSKDLTATMFDNGDWETFEFVRLENNKVALRAGNGKFVSADRSSQSRLIADRDQTAEWEQFELKFLGDNKIALKSSENKFVSVKGDDQNNILIADADSMGTAEVLRVYTSY